LDFSLKIGYIGSLVGKNLQTTVSAYIFIYVQMLY
jgi:hypothetical protein